MSLQERALGELVASKPAVFNAVKAVLRRLPAAAKWLVVLLFLLNAKSWPLMWHYRVFRPVFIIRGEYYFLLLRTLFDSKKTRDKKIDEWLDSAIPIGEVPFDKVAVYKARATLDDSDFNGHLSNSSYAKTLDSARFYMALDMFIMFFRAGGWLALGGTHFIYLREIPVMQEYEVRSSIASWDQKWLFIVHRFVSKPKGKKSKKQTPETNGQQSNTPDQGVQNILHASLRTQADAISSINTPYASTPSDTATQDTTAALKTAAASLVYTEEPDGVTLHTIAVSEVCFKIGRITVPPVVALATNGFSTPPSEIGSSLAEYSKTNPPPHWPKAKAVMSVPLGGSTKKLRELLAGGWRNVPEGERWWEHALSGVVEQRRMTRLEVVASLRSGMEGAKALVSM
ncbi:Protein THEM6 [Leucoagaricus sp. SymC.cos]|nr:Protein THEM6 [Leucoagaricus sp. SymC.cos]